MNRFFLLLIALISTLHADDSIGISEFQTRIKAALKADGTLDAGEVSWMKLNSIADKPYEPIEVGGDFWPDMETLLRRDPDLAAFLPGYFMEVAAGSIPMTILEINHPSIDTAFLQRLDWDFEVEGAGLLAFRMEQLKSLSLTKGTKKSRLKSLALIAKIGPRALDFESLIAPLMVSADEEISTAAVAAAQAIDPGLLRALKRWNVGGLWVEAMREMERIKQVPNPQGAEKYADFLKRSEFYKRYEKLQEKSGDSFSGPFQVSGPFSMLDQTNEARYTFSGSEIPGEATRGILRLTATTGVLARASSASLEPRDRSNILVPTRGGSSVNGRPLAMSRTAKALELIFNQAALDEMVNQGTWLIKFSGMGKPGGSCMASLVFEDKSGVRLGKPREAAVSVFGNPWDQNGRKSIWSSLKVRFKHWRYATGEILNSEIPIGLRLVDLDLDDKPETKAGWSWYGGGGGFWEGTVVFRSKELAWSPYLEIDCGTSLHPVKLQNRPMVLARTETSERGENHVYDLSGDAPREVFKVSHGDAAWQHYATYSHFVQIKGGAIEVFRRRELGSESINGEYRNSRFCKALATWSSKKENFVLGPFEAMDEGERELIESSPKSSPLRNFMLAPYANLVFIAPEN